MYYLLTDNLATRTALLAHLKQAGVLAVFHYVPLHSAPAGQKYGRSVAELAVTTDLSERLLRLPLWVGLEEEGAQERVIESVLEFFGNP
jgi:dTDP-4-amino-4,6-dideoxygalactose transaminase